MGTNNKKLNTTNRLSSSTSFERLTRLKWQKIKNRALIKQMKHKTAYMYIEVQT